MGKRRKNKSKQNSESLGSEDLLAQARAHLAAGKFRKARDTAKILFKRDAALARPLLVEANQSLAEEMLAKGQESEARTVLEYLKTIATPEELAAMERRAARAAGDWSVMAEDALAALANADDGPVTDEMRRRADEAVIAFAPPEAGPWADEVRAIQTALEAACAERWDEARAELRKVSRRSPFSHWTLFIKGLAAFCSGDRRRAHELFEALPPGSATAAAAEGWLPLLRNRDDGAGGPSPTIVQLWCNLAGAAQLSRPLIEAEKLWRADKIGAAYDILKRGLDFPCVGNSLVGQLSRLFFSAAFILPGRAVDNWLNFIDRRLAGKRLDLLEIEEFVRIFLRHEGPLLADQSLTDDVRAYLESRAVRCGADPLLESYVRTWLGKILAEPERQFGFRASQPRNADAAIKNLERAVELAPDSVAPCLALCEVYEATRRKAERNRLLDRMSERFPKHKETLLLAGRHALERKAYRKAVRFFQQAREADPLDAGIPDLVAEGLSGQLRLDYEKRKFAKARKLWDEELWPLADDSESPWRSRWALLARRAVLEGVHESVEAGRDWLQRAVDSAPGAAVVWLARLLFHEEITLGAKKQRLPKSELGLPNNPAPSLANLALMLELWNRSNEEGRLGRYPDSLHRKVKSWLSGQIGGAVRQPFERREVMRIFELLDHDPFHGDLAGSLARALWRLDRDNPLYRFFKLREDGFDLHDAKEMRELEKIEAGARKRGDRETVALIEKERAALRNEANFHPPPIGNDDEDFAYFNDPPDDFAEPPPGFAPPPDDLAGLATLLDDLANAPEELIKELRKTRPKGMPAAVFDEMVAAARGEAPGPPTPSPRPRPTPSRKPNDPNQLDLF